MIFIFFPYRPALAVIMTKRSGWSYLVQARLTDVGRHAWVQRGDHRLHRVLGLVQDGLHHGVPSYTLDKHT